MTIILVHAAHGKHVPGRKTEKAEARWLAKRMRYGLLPASFMPPKGQRDLRDLTRYRTTLVQERAREVHRVQGVLERANITLAAVVSEVMGGSGRAMLEALIAGKAAPAEMAALAKRRMRSTLPLLEQALTGVVRDHHRRLLAMQLAHIDFLDEQISALSDAIHACLLTLSAPKDSPGPSQEAPADHCGPVANPSPRMPFPRAVELLETLPGVDQRGAARLVAESGIAMTRCGTAPR